MKHPDVRPGDWICPDQGCTNVNFASRMICRLCKMCRPGVDPVFARLNPNPLPMHATHPHPHGGGGGGGGGSGGHGRSFRLGDWKCPKKDCRNHNYASRSTCRMCPEPRPVAALALMSSASIAAGDKGGGGRRRDGGKDWKCPRDECQNRNFASRTVCRMCPEPKPDGCADDCDSAIGSMDSLMDFEHPDPAQQPGAMQQFQYMGGNPYYNHPFMYPQQYNPYMYGASMMGPAYGYATMPGTWVMINE